MRLSLNTDSDNVARESSKINTSYILLSYLHVVSDPR